MEPDEYERMFHAEDRLWWYLGMRAITHAFIKRFISSTSRLKILDAGCGTGDAMCGTLGNYGRVTGIDVSPLALGFCRMRNLRALAQGSVTEIPFISGYFDLVTCFDVLYSQGVTNDLAAAAEFLRVLRPGGFLLLRLPAYDWLRGGHDVTVHTARRYTVPQVVKLLEKSGFSVLHISYVNMFLFPFALVKRMLERIWHPAPNSSDLSLQVGLINDLLKRILSSEAFLATHFNLPFGLSVMALAKKT